MTHRRTKRSGAALAAVLLVAACGSGDDEGANDDGDIVEPADEPAGEPADEPADEPANEPADEPAAEPADEPADEPMDDGDDDTILIDDFDDIPSECVDLMADFLRSIEGEVSGIDWDNATLEQLEEMGTALDVPTTEFDERSAAAGCDRYEIGVDDDQGLDFAIRVAEREAPGTVGWLEFIATFAGLGDTVDDVTGMDEDSGGETGSAGPDGDLPTDCESTKDYLRDQAMEYGTIDNVPMSEFPNLMGAVQNLTVQCTIQEASEFAEDPAIAAFLGG